MSPTPQEVVEYFFICQSLSVIAPLLAQSRQTSISQIKKSKSTPISQAPAAEIWLSRRKAREGYGAATGEQLGNLKTCQNGNLILINQVKLYKDKRLQGFCYQGLPRKNYFCKTLSTK